MKDAREVNERGQDRRKEYADTRHQHHDLVLLKSHTQSNATKGFTSKLGSKRDGPYRVCKIVNSNTYEVETADRNKTLVGKYNVSALTMYNGDSRVTPVNPIRSRGRPRQN